MNYHSPRVVKQQWQRSRFVKCSRCIASPTCTRSGWFVGFGLMDLSLAENLELTFQHRL